MTAVEAYRLRRLRIRLARAIQKRNELDRRIMREQVWLWRMRREIAKQTGGKVQ